MYSDQAILGTCSEVNSLNVGGSNAFLLFLYRQERFLGAPLTAKSFIKL